MKVLKVKRITKLNKTGKVVNINVLKNHTFVTKSGIVTHNCDGLTKIAQQGLRNIIEEYSNNLRFICTANFPSEIIDPLKSRLQTIDFSFNTADKKEMSKQLFKRLLMILRNENTTITDPKILGSLMQTHLPDIRHIIKSLQTYGMQNGNVIDENILTVKNDGDFNSFIAFVKKSTYEDLVKFAYECSPESILDMITNNLGELTLGHDKNLEIINLINHFDRGFSMCLSKQTNMLALIMNFKKYL